MTTSHEAYRPIDLSTYCTAGVELLGGGFEPKLGERILQGIPFHIAQGSRAFIAFGPELRQEPVTVPIASAAYAVVVAHRLLDSQLMAGGPVGTAVAEYIFRLKDGSQHGVPIRERFEIADLSTFGQLPFLALPDEKNGMRDRWSGAWSAAGYRQTEVTQGWPRQYCLWRWTNPTPRIPLESMQIVHSGPPFLETAITLGLNEDDPFLRLGQRPVRIELKDPDRPADHVLTRGGARRVGTRAGARRIQRLDHLVRQGDLVVSRLRRRRQAFV